MWATFKVQFLCDTIFLLLLIQSHPSHETNPCRLAKKYRHPKSTPFIRLVDELSQHNDEIVLGSSGLAAYSLIPPPKSDTSPTPTTLIECSSSLGKPRWSYRGRGASSGVKVVSRRWTKETGLKGICNSATLVFTNVTDQLVGEYSCGAGEDEGNSFILFVPQSTPFYHKEGETVKITLSTLSKPVVLPCISKRRSGAGIRLYREEISENGTNLIPIHGPHVTFDPFTGFHIHATKSLFDGDNVARFICKFEKNFDDEELKNKTLLRIEMKLRQEEKFAPDNSPVFAISPYFSWTSKTQPEVVLEKGNDDISTITTGEWQQIYIKGDFEQEGNSSASIFYLGSLQLVGGGAGEQGKVRLNKAISGEGMEWEYTVLDKDKEPLVGLSYHPELGEHVFICVSGTERNPNVTFKGLTTDEINTDSDPDYTLTECHNPSNPMLGCVQISSTLLAGEVTCVADGVLSTTIRYPIGFTGPSRPFFLERGSTLQLTLDEGDNLILPCLTNAPESETSVYLFWRNETYPTWEKIWPGENNEEPSLLHNGIGFYPHHGFHLDPTSTSSYLQGQYLCSSSPDVNDTSDAVSVRVNRNSWRISPKQTEIEGGVSYALKWAWSRNVREITVLEPGLKQHVQFNPSGEGWTRAELVLNESMFQNGTVINVTLIRDGVEIHQWRFNKTISTLLGLNVTTSWDKLSAAQNTGTGTASSYIEMLCRGSHPTNSTGDRDSPRLNYYLCQNGETCELVKKCAEKDCSPYDPREESGDTSNCVRTLGCIRRRLLSFPLNGYLKAVCHYNGITTTKTLFDVFFREEAVSTSGSTDLAFLSAHASSSESVGAMGANLEWDIGDVVTFSCGASPAHFSQGIRWGLEDGEGEVHIQPEDPYDPQWKHDSSSPQLLSTMTFPMTNFDLRRVWCFLPTIDNPSVWKNLSQVVFIRGEIDLNNCADTEPSIRILTITPSQLSLNLSTTRLDKVGHFIVPTGLLQLTVRVTASEPVEWSFTGLGPSSTPTVQNDRSMSNFYDPSTYCYTSKLSINLRHASVERDTGDYIAKIGNNKSLRFHLVVPSTNPLRNGNETDHKNKEDLIEQKRIGQLKHKIVGEMQVFTCTSETGETPNLQFKSSRQEDTAFERKECGEGCSILITKESQGTITCLGDGINATYAFGGVHAESTGPQVMPRIWYDSDQQSFKCQITNESSNLSSILPPGLDAITCKRPNECGIMMSKELWNVQPTHVMSQCGPDCSQVEIKDTNLFSIFLRCNGNTFSQFFKDRGVTQVATKESVATLKKIRLDVVSFQRRDGINAQTKLRCFANRYFYSRGIVWGLEKRDGTMQFQDLSTSSETEMQSYNSYSSEIRLEELDETQVKRVWCFVPLLDSTKWANASISTPINKLVHNLVV